MKQSSIFLHSVTLIDLAFLSAEGKPVGLSVEPVFTVSGSTDNPEQVVIDFSQCKKVIKSLIDDEEEGFDHKLLIDPDHPSVKTLAVADDGNYHIQTNALFLSVPTNAVNVVSGLLENVEDQESLLVNLCTALQDYLNERMAYLGVKVHVDLPEPIPADLEAICSGLGIIDMASEIFDYTHGLPKSSSWGCQNIMHGHTSFVLLGRERLDPNNSDLYELTSLIAGYLHDSYLYDNSDEKAAENTAKGLEYAYRTNRGDFLAVMTPLIEVIGMPYAPTIENIVDHVSKKFAKELNKYGVSTLMISEGLLKGAFLTSSNWEA